MVAGVAVCWKQPLGYVLVVQLVFARAPLRFAARLALAELAFGAAVSLGGAGSIALGAWVLHAVGVPTRRIVERSAVLFLLTSAANAIVLVVFGIGLWLGLEGTSDPLLSILPAAAGLAILLGCLALPRWVDRHHDEARSGRLASTVAGLADGIRTTRTMLITPNWRLLGAYAYLLCDIAVLWACFKALGYDIPVAPLVLAYQIGYLANIIPIPGGIACWTPAWWRCSSSTGRRPRPPPPRSCSTTRSSCGSRRCGARWPTRCCAARCATPSSPAPPDAGREHQVSGCAAKASRPSRGSTPNAAAYSSWTAGHSCSDCASPIGLPASSACRRARQRSQPAAVRAAMARSANVWVTPGRSRRLRG